MIDYLVKGDFIYKKDGTLVGRIEHGEVCDQHGSAFFKLKGSEITNIYGSLIAKVDKGKIISTSGGVLGTVSSARRSFENSNSRQDVEVAALWLAFVKGIK